MRMAERVPEINHIIGTLGTTYITSNTTTSSGPLPRAGNTGDPFVFPFRLPRLEGWLSLRVLRGGCPLS